MNIDTTITTTTANTGNSNTVKTNTQSSSDFKQELNSLSAQKSNEETSKTEKSEKQPEAKESKTKKEDDSCKEENIDEALDGLQNVVQEVNQAKTPVNQKEEISSIELKEEILFPDKLINSKKEENIVINNDMNIQEPKEPVMPQMDSGMNFDSKGRPFSAFVQQKNQQKLALSENDLKEESEILSTMAENIAMVNKNNMVQQEKSENKIKTVHNSDGIRKVDTKTNITVDTIAKYDSVIMDKSDVDFFAKLVENGSVDMASVKNAEKSSQVSKTLADLLAKSMQENKPVRIDFDNNISVIIRISKDGKISADFLPSSQVAEAYLKENLPLLRQKFDDNNINYDELNQRRQRQDDRNNRKKGRDDE